MPSHLPIGPALSLTDRESSMQNGSGPPKSKSTQRLFADQVHKQFEHTGVGTAATLINSILLVFVLRDQIEHLNLLIWMAGAGLVSVGRLIVCGYYKKSRTQFSEPEKWNIWFIVTLFLSGVLWGSTAIFLFPPDSIGHQVFIAFVVGGMVAGAVGALTSVLAAFFIFSVPALLPVCVHFFMLGSEIYIAMGVMLLLFMLLMGMTAMRMHKNSFYMLALRYERDALIQNLQQEVEQRKQAQDNLHHQKEQIEEIVTQRTAQLKNANQRLRAILTYAPLVIWAIDKQGTLTFFDGQGLEKMGVAPESAIGRAVSGLFAENRRFIDITQRVLAGEFISEAIHFHKGYFEIRYQPMMGADNRLVGAIGVAIDVTEQAAAREALRKGEEKYRELVENINDVIYAIDGQGLLTYISPVIESVLGYPVVELIGKCFFDFVHPQDQECIERDFDAVIELGGGPREYRFLDKTGETKWCRVNSRPIADGRDTIGIQGVLVDITWSKRLEEQLLRAQKMEALGILAGGVAHDLNNILSGLVSYPELLLMNLSQESPLHKPLTTIKQSGENAAAVVQDLLTLARRGVPTYELLNLNDMVQQCIHSPEIQSLIYRHPTISMTTRFESDLLNIYGSSVHVLKTLSNLIFNAVEAMPEGGRIEIATGNHYADTVISGYDTIIEGEYVVLSITDSGIGISESDQSRIFEPFYTKKVMGRSGSGLGMAVVWGTVKDHHGYIDLQSKEGEGAQFKLFFPATRDQLQKRLDAEEQADFTGNGEFILVVDDMPAQREIATRILDRLGYRIQSVASGEQAVEFIGQHKVDLVMLDMIMDPGMDGYDTYRQILAIRPGQKAIIASGYSETDRVKKTFELGAGRYIKKPYTIATIGRIIKEELQK
jgi:PAS domain S-box-containing protein